MSDLAIQLEKTSTEAVRSRGFIRGAETQLGKTIAELDALRLLVHALPEPQTIKLDIGDSVAAAIEQANATGKLIDLEGGTLTLDRSAELTRLPRFVNGTIDGAGHAIRTLPDQQMPVGDIEFIDLALTNIAGVWVRGLYAARYLSIDNCAIRDSISGLQLDSAFEQGGLVRGLHVRRLHNPTRRSWGLALGYNNPGGLDQGLSPVTILAPDIDGVSTGVQDEAHGVATFAQPIYLLGGTVNNVAQGIGENGAESIYTKASGNVIRGVHVHNSGGEAAFAIKHSGTINSTLEDCSFSRDAESRWPRHVVKLDASHSVVRRISVDRSIKPSKYDEIAQGSLAVANHIEHEVRQ